MVRPVGQLNRLKDLDTECRQLRYRIQELWKQAVQMGIGCKAQTEVCVVGLDSQDGDSLD